MKKLVPTFKEVGESKEASRDRGWAVAGGRDDTWTKF